MKSHALEADFEVDHYFETDFAPNVLNEISKLDGFSVLEVTSISQVFESCPGLHYRLQVTGAELETSRKIFTVQTQFALVIGHFRITFSLFLKASLGTHPFI